MSWHHGDWLSFAQAAGSIIAIFGAFGAVLFQHSMHVRHTKRVAERDLLRDRYRSSTYAEALIENAIECAAGALRSIDAAATRSGEIGDISFVHPRMDEAEKALGVAIHSQLPTEITRSLLSAWMAAQQFCHALHRTEKVSVMKFANLKSFCQEQFSVLNSSLEVVRLSKAKWERRLNEE
jgi:hypothetical protein